MPKVNIYDKGGKVVGELELNENVFAVDINESSMHAAVLNQLANKRQGTQSTKTRSEVRGGGRKPWRQKGTGRARTGSIRASHWVKGGITHGPKPRSYKYAIPRKMKRIALKSALTSKDEDENLFVIDDLKYESIKTKQVVELLENLNVDTSVLIVLDNSDEILSKSARNIQGVKTALVNTINTYDILKYDKFITTREAVAKIEEVYA